MKEKAINNSAANKELKKKIIPLATTLRKMDFKIYATEHTAETLRNAGLNGITALHKIKEVDKKPNILEYLLERKIDLVINIPPRENRKEHEDALEDEYTIRRLAVEFNIPVVTNFELALTLTNILKQRAGNAITTRSLNEYMDSLLWKYW